MGLLELACGGGSIRDTKGCSFRASVNSCGLDLFLEMSETIQKALV